MSEEDGSCHGRDKYYEAIITRNIKISTNDDDADADAAADNADKTNLRTLTLFYDDARLVEIIHRPKKIKIKIKIKTPTMP